MKFGKDAEISKLAESLREATRELGKVRGDLEAKRDERDLANPAAWVVERSE